MNEEKKAIVHPEAAPFCSRCGHCEAICPEGAISVTYDGAGPVPALPDETIPATKDLRRLIAMRRSVRAYKETPVPRETLLEILDTVRYAPTGMNGQSVNWIVLEDPKKVQSLVGKVIDWSRDLLEKVPNHPLAPILPMLIAAYDQQGEDHICHGAPHLIIAYGHKENPIAYTDGIIALTHVDIMAPAYGLGTCWGGIVQIALDDKPELMAEVGIPEGFKSLYTMMIGYPKYQYKRIPKRNALQVTWL